MKRQFSGQQLIVYLFASMLIITLICLMVCGGYALSTTRDALLFSNETAMDVYFSDLTHAWRIWSSSATICIPPAPPSEP